MHLFQEWYKCYNLLVKIIKLTSYDRSFANRPRSTEYKCPQMNMGVGVKTRRVCQIQVQIMIQIQIRLYLYHAGGPIAISTLD